MTYTGTKPTNKARKFQDAVMRARDEGCETPSEAAETLRSWFLDADRYTQIDFMVWAAARWWSTVEEKSAPVRAVPARSYIDELRRMEKEERSKTVAALDAMWLDVVIRMTGAQVRAAHKLPPEMAAKIGDDQRVGEVFTAAELLAAKQGE